MKEYDFSKMNLKELASLVYEMLLSEGIDAVLVGGACVSIYSDNRYQSYDLDFVTYEELGKVEKVLSTIGFERSGRMFRRKECPYLIDFVNPPVAIGKEPVQNFNNMKVNNGIVQLLTPTDCVKDRLAAYYHWNDQQSLEQAVLVAKNHPVDLGEIKRWSESEGYAQKYSELMKSKRF